MDEVEFVRIKNELELPVEKEGCFIVEEISFDNAIAAYDVKYGINPKIVYRWAWVFYMPIPAIEDLPLFSQER